MKIEFLNDVKTLASFFGITLKKLEPEMKRDIEPILIMLTAEVNAALKSVKRSAKAVGPDEVFVEMLT